MPHADMMACGGVHGVVDGLASQLLEGVLFVLLVYLAIRIFFGDVSAFISLLQRLALSAREAMALPGSKRRRKRCGVVKFSSHEYPQILCGRGPVEAQEVGHAEPYQFFNTLIRDPHRWLEDLSSPRTQTWIEEERLCTLKNVCKQKNFAVLETFKQSILSASSSMDLLGTIFQRGRNFFYYKRSKTGTEQYVMYVTVDLSMEGEVLLDPDTILQPNANLWATATRVQSLVEPRKKSKASASALASSAEGEGTSAIEMKSEEVDEDEEEEDEEEGEQGERHTVEDLLAIYKKTSDGRSKNSNKSSGESDGYESPTSPSSTSPRLFFNPPPLDAFSASSSCGDGVQEQPTTIVHGTWVCDDGMRLAYGYTTGASQWLTIRVRDVLTGIDSPMEIDTIVNTCHVSNTSVAWLDSSFGFFYTCYSLETDEDQQGHQHTEAQLSSEGGAARASTTTSSSPLHSSSSQYLKHTVRFHRMRTSQAEDIIIYENRHKVRPSTAAPNASTGSKEAGGSGAGDDEVSDDDEEASDCPNASATWKDVEEQETRETFTARVTSDGHYLLIEIFEEDDDEADSHTSMTPSTKPNKLYYIDVAKFDGRRKETLGPCVKLIDSFESRWEYISNIEEDLWLRTNYKEPNFRVVKFTLPDLEIFEGCSEKYLAGALQSVWQCSLEWIPAASSGAVLESAGIAAHTVLVLKYRRNLSHEVLLYDITSFDNDNESNQHLVAELPHPPHGNIVGPHCNFYSPNIFYQFSGYADPGSMFRAIVTRDAFRGSIQISFEPLFSPEIAGLDLFKYETRLESCSTSGGASAEAGGMMGALGGGGGAAPPNSFSPSFAQTQLPLYLFMSNNLPERRPCILYAYSGCFGVSALPAFSLPLLLFVKHFDALLCVVNLNATLPHSFSSSSSSSSNLHAQRRRSTNSGCRGGGWESGETRREAAVNDLIAAADYLIKAKYTSKEQLSLLGGTSSGLLIGACINRRPDLFAAAVVEDGVFDLMRYHILSPPIPNFDSLGNQDNLEAAAAAAASAAATLAPLSVPTSSPSTNVCVAALAAQTIWASEFGCSEASADSCAKMHKISPLHNVRAPPPPTTFPAVLLLTSAPSSSSSSSSSIATFGNTEQKDAQRHQHQQQHEEACLPPPKVPPQHSFKFIAELQRVCGVREQVKPLLIHIDQQQQQQQSSARGGSAKENKEEEKELAAQRVALMLCFLAEHSGAMFREQNAHRDDEHEEEEELHEISMHHP